MKITKCDKCGHQTRDFANYQISYDCKHVFDLDLCIDCLPRRDEFCGNDEEMRGVGNYFIEKIIKDIK